MKFLYRSIAIYVDPNDNMFIVPTGYSDKYGTFAIDSITQLDAPYTDEEIECAMKLAMGRCFSIKPDDNVKESAIERYLKIKGYNKAVKDKKVIEFLWNADEGYTVTPTKKIPKQGYDHVIDKAFKLGLNPKEGDIAKAIREVVKISII